MPLLPAKLLTELPAGSVVEFENGDSTYALCNVDGAIHCIDGVCPHADGPLGQGTLHGSTIVCPWHGWEFNVQSGVAEVGGDGNVRTYPTTVKDGQIFVELP